MKALQRTCGILLLVFSVVVALPQERKRGKVNHYEEDFGLSSDVPGNSGEKVPVKLGRTIYQSAWSTEDSESSEENSGELTRTREEGKNRWSFSNALKLALNFVNKLRRESTYPVIGKNNNKNAPKYKIKNKSEDMYWGLFKKWLRGNKILKNDDSLSSYLSEHNSRFNDYNHKNHRKNPRRKSSENQNSALNKNRSFNEKRNRIKNSEQNIINKNKLSQAPKISNLRLPASEERSSEESSTLYKTRQHDTYSDENCDKDKDKSSNDLIKTSKKVNWIEGKETEDDDSCSHASTETAESGKQRKSHHNILEKHPNSKPTGKIYPETQAKTSLTSDSFDLFLNTKQQGTTSYPQTQRKTSFKTIPSANLATTKLQPITSSFAERPTKQKSKDNLTKKLKVEDTASGKNHISNQSPSGISGTGEDSKYLPSTQPKTSAAYQEKFRKKSKTAENVSQVNTPLSNASLQPQSKNNPKENSKELRAIESVPFTTISENALSSESQNKRTLKKNFKNSQMTEKVVPVGSNNSQTTDESIDKETSSNFSVAESVSTTTKFPSREKITLKEISKDQKTLPTAEPESSSLPKTSSKRLLNRSQNDLKGIGSTSHLTIPPSVDSSKSQNIRTVTENSEGSHMAKELSQTAVPVSSSATQTADENIPKLTSANLSKAGSISQKTTFSYPSQIQGKTSLNKVSKDSQMTEKISQLSSPKTVDVNENITKPIQNDSRVMKNVPFVAKPVRASSSKPHSIKHLKKISKDSQMPVRVLQPEILVSSSSQHTADEMIINEAANEYVPEAAESSRASSHKSMPIGISSSKPQGIRTLKENTKNSKISGGKLKPILVISSSPQMAEEIIVRETSNDLAVDKNDSREKESSKDSQDETIHSDASLTKLQNIRTPAASSQTADPIDLTETKSISHATESSRGFPHERMPISDSLFKPQSIRALNRNSENSQVTEEVLKPAILVNSTSPRTTDVIIIKEASNDLTVAKSDLPATAPVENSPLEPQGEKIFNETSNTSHKRDSNFSSSQPNEKHTLKEMDVLTKHNETSFKKVIHQKNTRTENTSKKSEFEPNYLFTKHKDSDIISNENYHSDKFTFVFPTSTTKNKDTNIKNSHFEELEEDSYIISDETDQESNENINAIYLAHRENADKSTALNIEGSAKENVEKSTTLNIGGSTKFTEELKENSHSTKTQSFASSSIEEFTDNEVEDKASEEQQEKFDTFLQYIYKHSNSSYFQSLRKNSDNL